MSTFDDPVTFNAAVVTNEKTTITNPRLLSVEVSNSAGSGGADPLPDTPAGYAILHINEQKFYIPLYDKPPENIQKNSL